MIKYQQTFEEMKPAGFDGLFDWDFILPAFAPTKIMPMDIDALIERHGKFLIFETKTLGMEIPDGQRIALEQLIKLGRGNIVLYVLWGKTKDTIQAIEIWKYHNSIVVKSDRITCSGEDILQKVSKWFNYANS